MRLWPFKRREERKYSAVGPNIARIHVGQAVWTPRRFDAFAVEAFTKNPIAFRAIKLVATNAARLPILLYDGKGKEIEAHPLLDLLAKPSAAYSGAAFLEAVYAYFLLAGNSYVEAVGPEGKPPRELWPLRPDRMQVVPGRFGLPEGYRYTVHGQPRDWRCDPITGRGPILHLRDFHPLDDWYGMSLIEAAAFGVDRHNAASAHNKALLDNGARPSGALVFKPVKVGADEYASAPKEMIDDARERLVADSVGPAAAGRPFVFSGDVDWREMGTSPKDMDFNEGKLDAARDICAAIGVPSILLVPGESTYSNRAEANLELFEQTVIPMAEAVISGLNGWLCPLFGDGLRLGIDLDNVSALEPRREIRRNSVMGLLREGVIGADEAREALQYGPRPPEAVGEFDASKLLALRDADLVEAAGYEPLWRYMRQAGLIGAGVTLQQFEAGVDARLEDDGEQAAALGLPPPPLQIAAPDTEEDEADEDEE